MKTGLYDQIVNIYLNKRIHANNDNHAYLISLDEADSNDYLAQYLYRVLAQGLSEVVSDKDGDSKVSKQITVCNEILAVLNSNGIAVDGLDVSETAERLMSIMDKSLTVKRTRPDTPLALGALLTGTRQDPSLVSQLKKEILSSDRVDILCSFIKWSGIRILKEELIEFTNKGNQLRIITTSYMGATDSRAIEFLQSLPNTQVKISYDTRRTRLHAKAYLFERETGFSSGYVGSSNISNAALTDGLEWNIKISQYEQPFQWEKIIATFDTYWNDNEFEIYTPSDKPRLEKALLDEKMQPSSDEFVMPNFDLNPYPFQKEILDAILVEREIHKKNKHLIVAATGTGKTMIAAFDFKAFRQKYLSAHNREPKLMFIAHREEILKQSMYTFRQVLRDQNFGDMLVGVYNPSQMDQIFVSIQSYNAKAIYDSTTSDYYDYVVVDEFHHAAAPSYRKLLKHVSPKCLLGLTATPERADNLDIKAYFDDHITAEIRLPDAIDRKLLCPFQYFGITDSVDYSHLKWQRGGYLQSELTNLYTADDIRAKLIAQKTVETVLNIKKVKGIGFCVSKAHAEYMSRKFNNYSIPSEFLTSDSSNEIRNNVKRRLQNYDINFIFVVDLYNEGVDIPDVDTVLFLRPTESLTIFLQQLGRGLRLCEGKDCLTVLDFIGQSHKKYRFDLKFQSLIQDKKITIDKEVEEGFPHLPAGCSIELERKSQDYILDNIRQVLNIRKNRLIQRIESFSSDTGKSLNFGRFMDYYSLETDNIYSKISWSRALVEAGVIENFTDKDEEKLRKGLRRIQHIDDIRYINFILEYLKTGKITESNNIAQLYLVMFALTIWTKQKFDSIEEAITELRENEIMLRETIMLLEYKSQMIKSISPKVDLPYTSALSLHHAYTQAEALAGLGYFDMQNNHTVQSGVLHIEDKKTDVFFITLDKNEKDYSPTTMYKDYAINERLFHWQSQSSTRVDSPTGQRYINHENTGNTILLFVRNAKSKNNLAQPYFFLGPARYVSHEGEKPINFVWELKYDLPAFLYRETARLVVG